MKRAIVLLSVLTSACVSSGKHEALQKEFDASQQALRKSNSENGELNKSKQELKAALEREEAKVRELGARVDKLEADLASATQARTALESEKSAMLKDKSSLQASIEDMKRALADLSKRKAAADARLAEFKGLINRFKSLIDAGKLKVKIADGRMVVELASDVLFASGSATLAKDGKASIAEVATVLASIPDRKFQVEGHTDDVPIKSAIFPSNWELASARALTVVKTMVEAGMPAERISAASYGEFKPARPNESPEGRAANRRIEIVVVPDLSSLPGFEELNRVAAQ